MNNLFKVFGLLTIVSLILLITVIYEDKQFKNNPLSKDILTQLKSKELQIRQKILQKYNLNVKIPILISDKLPNKLFGLAQYDQNMIKIVLNKNRFQESQEYMINNVLPHEYAHAMMFYFGDFTRVNGGHTKKWQQICKAIGGIKCDRFVDHDDILFGKLNF